MSVDNHHNMDYSGGFPVAVGDRQYAQDKFRDFRFLQSRIGQTMEAITGHQEKFIASGGQVTLGADPTKEINVSQTVGFVPWDVTVPNSWAALPPTTTTARIDSALMLLTAKTNFDITSTGAILDGVTVNYIKVVYTETDKSASQRNRAKKAGNYYSEKTVEGVLDVDGNGPTTSQLCLGTIIGNGIGSLAISLGFATPRSGRTEIHIRTQQDFNFYFGTAWQTDGGSKWIYANQPYYGATTNNCVIPEDTTIILYPPENTNLNAAGYPTPPNGPMAGVSRADGRQAYVLGNRVMLSNGSRIIGIRPEETVITNNPVDAANRNSIGFEANPSMSSAVSGVSTNRFTVASSANFALGDTVLHVDGSGRNRYYRVTLIPDGTHVDVDRLIRGSAAGNLHYCLTDIELSGFTADFNGNAYGLQESAILPVEFQFCLLGAVALSNFTAHVMNMNVTSKVGAAYNGTGTATGGAARLAGLCEFANIERCLATNGGAIYGVQSSYIHDIRTCMGRAQGGALHTIDYCTIERIYGCKVESGTAHVYGGSGYLISNCMISDIRDCIAYTHTGAFVAYGGGFYSITDSEIHGIYECQAISTSNQATGGAFHTGTLLTVNVVDSCEARGATGASGGCSSTVNNSVFQNISNCLSNGLGGASQGGGCHACDQCTFINFTSNVALNTGTTGEGGGCYGCDESVFLGTWYLNTCDGNAGAGQYDTIDNCTNYVEALIHDATARVPAAAAGTLNID